MKQLQDECRLLEDRCKAASGEQRRLLGLQKLESQTKLNVLKKQIRVYRIKDGGIAATFMLCSREMLQRVQYEMILKAAEREYDLNLKAAQELANTTDTEASALRVGEK